MSFLIHHFLENSADLYPDKEAVVHGDRRYSYSDVEKYSNQIANWLLSTGVERGDRIALLHRNSIGYIASYYGVLKAGAAVVPLNTGLDAREMGEMIGDCDARILISESFFSRIISELCGSEVNSLRSIAVSDDVQDAEKIFNVEYVKISEIATIFPDNRPCVRFTDQDLATVIYTSGSTGKHKGVMLSHLNVVTNTKSIVSYLPLTSDDRCMVILPLYYVYGKSLLNTHFFVSGTVVIDNRFTFPNTVLKNMIEERVTSFSGVPSTYSILVNRSSISEMSFPDLRYLTQAGGYLPSSIGERLAEIFQDKDFFIMYGATEASARLAFLEPQQFVRRMSSFGKAIPNVEMKIVTEEGIDADFEQEGEIIAHGSNIMLGYWNAPDETDKVLKDGWYYTGDLGRRDREGYFYVTGRKRDMIKVGIHKVSAREIEDVLYRHPGIHEAAVIGIPDENFGEAVKAVIVREPQTHLEEVEILEFCAENLPSYKVPKEIQFTDGLPKNESGKVMKRNLTELF